MTAAREARRRACLPLCAWLGAQLSDLQHLTREGSEEERQSPPPRPRVRLTLCTLGCLVGLCEMQVPGPSPTKGPTPLLRERSGNPDQGFVFFFFSNQASPGTGYGQSLDPISRNLPMKPVPRNYILQMWSLWFWDRGGTDHGIG